MKAELTAIIEPAPEGGYWAICPEVPGANGQGETVEETKRNLIEAIQLIFEDRRSDIMRGLPEDAIQEKILVGWREEIWSDAFALLAVFSSRGWKPLNLDESEEWNYRSSSKTQRDQGAAGQKDSETARRRLKNTDGKRHLDRELQRIWRILSWDAERLKGKVSRVAATGRSRGDQRSGPS
jgi:predicted RNase H-like HicB family nuclease